MLLKRHYSLDADAHDAGVAADMPVPVLDHVEILHTGTSIAQHFSTGLVMAALVEGWLSIDEAAGTLTLHTQPEALVYTIVRRPGVYCCHCDATLISDQTGEMARWHVLQHHEGVSSPDAMHPSGYRRVNAYECLLDAAQHERWRRPAYATVSHARYLRVEGGRNDG